MVSFRGGFSDRNNIKPENTQMQLTSFDVQTRNKLRNRVSVCFDLFMKEHRVEEIQYFYKSVLSQLFSEPVRFDKYYDDNAMIDLIDKTIENDEYDDVLTLIEFLSYKLANESSIGNNIFCSFNELFEREYIGYRFIDRIIVPITNSEEQHTIEAAADTKYSTVNEFVAKAIAHFSNRKKPDYENCIKESITAVEELCNIINNKKGTLGETLDRLEKNGFNIHPCLKQAFDKLYGYTSDKKGIRHAGQLGGKGATFAEAKFMLVTCGAFISYLIEANEQTV